MFYPKTKLSPRATLERQDALEGDNLFFYNFALKFTKNKRVLDVGTGYGFGANYLLGNGAKKVLGIDLDKEAINFAKKSFFNKNLDFQVMDATSLDLPEKSYDVIIIFDALEHLPADKYLAFLAKIKELLAGKGVILISTPNKLINSPNRETSANPYHLKEYTALELKEAIKKFFPQTEIFGVNVREKHQKQADQLTKKFRYVFFNYFGQFKLARNLISLVSKEIRQTLSGAKTLPKLEIEDYQLVREKIDQAKILLTISQT